MEPHDVEPGEILEVSADLPTGTTFQLWPGEAAVKIDANGRTELLLPEDGGSEAPASSSCMVAATLLAAARDNVLWRRMCNHFRREMKWRAPRPSADSRQLPLPGVESK